MVLKLIQKPSLPEFLIAAAFCFFIGSVPFETPSAVSSDDSSTATICGVVVNQNGDPVPNALVLLCDQESGIPIHRISGQPFTREFGKKNQSSDNDVFNLFYVVTESDGTFRFSPLQEGVYRVFAQRWLDATKPIGLGLDFLNGRDIEVLGWKDGIQIPSGDSGSVVLRPAGSGILHIDQDAPNDDTYILLSTRPPLGDPILLYRGWGSDFLSHMIAVNRMPDGETTFRGLPEGKLYVAIFANDNLPGGGGGEVDILSGQTTEVVFPIVAYWSDGHHTPPDRLKPLVDELVEEKLTMENLYQAMGCSDRNAFKKLVTSTEFSLDTKVTLPDGRSLTMADLIAAMEYTKMHRYVEKRKARKTQ